MGKIAGAALKIGTLIGAVALQEAVRPHFRELFDPASSAPAAPATPVTPAKKGTAGMFGMGDDIFGSSYDPTADVPSDIVVPFVPGQPYIDPSQPYYGYSQPTYYPGSYPSYPSSYPYQQPQYSYPYPYSGYPYQQSYLPSTLPASTLPGYPSPVTSYPSVIPQSPLSPISSLMSTLFPSLANTGYGYPTQAQMNTAEAQKDALVQYGLSQGVLQATSCFGQAAAGQSQYHNCMFSVQTSRGSKTMNFTQAAAAMKRYQKTGKL